MAEKQMLPSTTTGLKPKNKSAMQNSGDRQTDKTHPETFSELEEKETEAITVAYWTMNLCSTHIYLNYNRTLFTPTLRNHSLLIKLFALNTAFYIQSSVI